MLTHLLNLRIILDDNGVFKVGTRAGIGAITIQSVLGVASSAARIDGDVKLGISPAQTGGKMDAVDVRVVTLGEDDAVEGFVDLNVHLHQVLFASHVKADNFGHVGLSLRPGVSR